MVKKKQEDEDKDEKLKQAKGKVANQNSSKKAKTSCASRKKKWDETDDAGTKERKQAKQNASKKAKTSCASRMKERDETDDAGTKERKQAKQDECSGREEDPFSDPFPLENEEACGSNAFLTEEGLIHISEIKKKFGSDYPELMIYCSHGAKARCTDGGIQSCLNYCLPCFLRRKNEKEKVSGRLGRSNITPTCSGFPSSHVSERADFRLFGEKYIYYQPEKVKINRPWLKKCSGCKGLWYLDEPMGLV